MKKLRFFESILLEALDQRIIITLNCHRKTLKRAEHDISKEQQELERAIYDATNTLTSPKTNALIEYKIKGQYKIETEILREARTILWKNMLELEMAIFKESLNALRELLTNELALFEKSNIQINNASRIHNEITTKIPIYSKILNAQWVEIEKARKIFNIINSKTQNIIEEEKKLMEQIPSIKITKIENDIQIIIQNSQYNENVTKVIELYFTRNERSN